MTTPENNEPDVDVTLEIRTPKSDLPYKVVAISTYKSDLAELDAMVERCQAAGVRRMNRSRLLRIAIKRLDLDAVIAELSSVR